MEEKELLASTLVLSPKDLVGDSDSKFEKVKSIFRAAKSTASSSKIKVVVIEDIDFICGS